MTQIYKKLSFKEAKSLLRKAKSAFPANGKARWDRYIATIPVEGLTLEGKVYTDGYRAICVDLASGKDVSEVTRSRGLDNTDLGYGLNIANAARLKKGLPALF